MARLIAIACAAWLLAAVAVAQETQEPEPVAEPAAPPDELTLPPRIQDNPPPGETILEPAPDEREDMLEVVVTTGTNQFNLPDLGGEFRREEEYDPTKRMEVSFLYLYDPDNRDPAEEAFPSLDEQLGKPTIPIFRIRFGRRGE